MDGMEPMAYKISAFSAPFVTGRVYNIWWLTGIDFTHLAVDISQLYEDADEGIIFKFNYTDTRELFEIGHLVNKVVEGDYIEPKNDSIDLDISTCDYGDYFHNDTERIMLLCASSRGKLREYQYMDVNAIGCRTNCSDSTEDFEREDFIRLWSNATQWPNEVIPTDG